MRSRIEDMKRNFEKWKTPCEEYQLAFSEKELGTSSETYFSSDVKVQMLLIGSYWSLVGIIFIWTRLGTSSSLNRILLECSPLRAEKTSFNSWFLSVLETEDDISCLEWCCWKMFIVFGSLILEPERLNSGTCSWLSLILSVEH